MELSRKRHRSANSNRVSDCEPALRGPATNRFAGRRTQSLRALQGGTYGPAGLCRKYNWRERAAFEQLLMKRGLL